MVEAMPKPASHFYKTLKLFNIADPSITSSMFNDQASAKVLATVPGFEVVGCSERTPHRV
jgi:hypothetical protein